MPFERSHNIFNDHMLLKISSPDADPLGTRSLDLVEKWLDLLRERADESSPSSQETTDIIL